MRKIPVQLLDNLTTDELIVELERENMDSEHTLMKALCTHIEAIDIESRKEIEDLQERINDLEYDARDAEANLDDVYTNLSSLASSINCFLKNPEYAIEQEVYNDRGELESLHLLPLKLRSNNLSTTRIEIEYDSYDDTMDCSIFIEASHVKDYKLYSRSVANLKVEVLPYLVHEVYSYTMERI